VRIYHRDAITGGGSNALDGIDGTSLSDGDRAFVMDGTFRAYRLVDPFGELTDPPEIVAPETNAGLKRWVRQTT